MCLENSQLDLASAESVALNLDSNERVVSKRSGKLKKMNTPRPSSPSTGPASSDMAISQPLMEEFWNPSTLSAADSHARTFLLLASARDSMENDQLFGPSSSGSFAKLNPDGSWAKTSQGFYQVMMDGSSETFSETWPAPGSMSNGECFQRLAWEPRISENEFLFWPTPRSPKYGVDSTKRTRENRKNHSDLESAIGGPPNPNWLEWLMGFPRNWTGVNASEMPSSPKSRKKSAK